MRAVLIGFGSVGCRHAEVLSRRVSSLAIVDPLPRARASAQARYPRAVVLPALDHLWQLPWDWRDVFVVIATWGPSHYDVFIDCVEHGVRYIVCEKPLAHSLYAAHRMVEWAEAKDVSLGVNHVQRYLGVDTGLRLLSERYDLGEPQSIVVHGGASCLVTNGIHFVDLAISLLGGQPLRVVSTAYGEAMNPRSKSLLFYGGTAVWSFAAGREAVITLSNRSSVFPTFTVYYLSAVIHLCDFRRVVVLRRDPSEMSPDLPVTRTGKATEVLYDGPVPGAPSSVADAFDRLYGEVLERRPVTFRPRQAYEALQACIGALLAAENRFAVDLPIVPQSLAGRRAFSIS